MNYNILVKKGDELFVATNLDLGIVSQGKTIEEAIENITEATELYLEDDQDIEYNFSQAILTTVNVGLSYKYKQNDKIPV